MKKENVVVQFDHDSVDLSENLDKLQSALQLVNELPDKLEKKVKCEIEVQTNSDVESLQRFVEQIKEIRDREIALPAFGTRADETLEDEIKRFISRVLENNSASPEQLEAAARFAECLASAGLL